jgi:hypothetical protein
MTQPASPMTTIKFEQVEVDTQTGCAQWEIRLDNDGVYEVVGLIEKNTCRCGDGYRADSYSVNVELDEWEEAREEYFQVRNSWSRGEGMTARQALAKCKAFAKEQLKARMAKER